MSCMITHYEVLYSKDGTSQSTLTTSNEQLTIIIAITGTVGRSYEIRASALSAVGAGGESASIAI